MEGGWLAAFSPSCALWSPLPEGHQAPLDPLARLCGLPTNCGWGHSSFYLRCQPVHSKSSTSDPTASFLPVPTAGQADLWPQHHRDVADGKEGIDGSPCPVPHPPLCCTMVGGGGRLPVCLGPAEVAAASQAAVSGWCPQSQATKGWTFGVLVVLTPASHPRPHAGCSGPLPGSGRGGFAIYLVKYHPPPPRQPSGSQHR